MKKSNEYKIISLEVVDFKRISAASIMIGDGLTKITGANGAGKSSIIDAIFYALKPDGVEMPINESARRAKITLRIGNEEQGFTIERSVTESGKYLTITNDAGKKISSPQAFLNSLFVEMADPMVFMDMKQREQCEALRIACKCDTRELDSKHKETYDERTIVNRRLDQAEKALIDLGDEPEKLELKSASELTNKSDELLKFIASMDSKFERGKQINSSIEAEKKEISRIETDEDITNAEIEKLQAKLKSLASLKSINQTNINVLHADREKLREECEKDLSKYKESKASIEAIKEEIQGIDEHNKKASLHDIWTQRKIQLDNDRNTAHGESYQLTQDLEAIAKEKRELLELADYPVPDMNIEGDKIYVGAVPFSNLNTAEKIKISTFVAIAQNPQLKMIIIRNGSMLDDNSLKIVQDIADNKDYQIIMEKVSMEGEVDSIHVIDGHIQPNK